MEQFPNSLSITLLGSAGGAAKAVLAILNQAIANEKDPIYEVLKNAKFHLVDIKQKDRTYYDELFSNLKGRLYLYEINLQNVVEFKQHLKEKRTSVVIDVSGADTIRVLSCCNELGICYINSALENEYVDQDDSLIGFQLTERYTRFEKEKEKFTNTKAIIGSGMNPGVVQWMVVELMKERPNESTKSMLYCRT